MSLCRGILMGAELLYPHLGCGLNVRHTHSSCSKKVIVCVTIAFQCEPLAVREFANKWATSTASLNYTKPQAKFITTRNLHRGQELWNSGKDVWSAPVSLRACNQAFLWAQWLLLCRCNALEQCFFQSPRIQAVHSIAVFLPV